MQYVCVGIAAWLVYTTLTRQSPNPLHSLVPSCAGMVSNLSGAVSARIAGATGKGPVDANTKLGAVARGVAKLVDCKKPGAEAWREMTDGDKRECEREAREWLAAHPIAVVMIFAPWCGHCHTAMPTFASTVGDAGVDALLINAEALPQTALSGDGCIFPCEFFPTFCAQKDGALVQADTPADAVAKAVETTAAAATSGPAAPSGAAGAADDGPTVTSMLASLF